MPSVAIYGDSGIGKTLLMGLFRVDPPSFNPRSITTETGPQIFIEKGPLSESMHGRQRSPRRSWLGLRSRGERGSARSGFFGEVRLGVILGSPMSGAILG